LVVKQELIEDGPPSQTPKDILLFNLAEAIIVVNVTWNANDIGLNESFINIGIAHQHDVGICLVLQQCFHIKKHKNDEKIAVNCGAFSYIIKSKTIASAGSLFYIKKTLV
jgi:hypothetical protein